MFSGISFSGRMGSGKNYCAELLRRSVVVPHARKNGAYLEELSFGMHVKRLAGLMLNAPCITEAEKNTSIPPGFHYDVKPAVRMFFFPDHDHRDSSDTRWWSDNLMVSGTLVCTYLELVLIIEEGLEQHAPVTRGGLLQILGSEIIRKKVHEDFWIEIVHRQILKLNKDGVHWIVTDARFPNELEMIGNCGGLCLYVKTTVPYSGARCPNHISERALDGVSMRTLRNDHTLQTNANLHGLMMGTWDDVCAKLAMVRVQTVGDTATNQ